MGASSSTLGTPVKSNGAKADSGLTKALQNGNQVFLREDVAAKLADVSKTFKEYNDYDYDKIIQHISEHSQYGTVISEPIKKSLTEFHNALIASIDNTGKQPSTFEDINAQKKQLKSFMQKPDATFFDNLKTYYGKPLDETINQLLNDQSIDKSMITEVRNITESIKSLKVKYKFFEYKYIELNLFLILVVTKSYEIINTFVNDVLAFNQQRDESRKQEIDNILKSINSMISSAELQVKPDDFSYLTSMMDQMNKQIAEDAKSLESQLAKTSQVTNEGLIELFNNYIENANDPKKINELITKLSEKQQKIQSEQRKQGQSGGFIRDHSILPQAFYEIDDLQKQQ